VNLERVGKAFRLVARDRGVGIAAEHPGRIHASGLDVLAVLNCHRDVFGHPVSRLLSNSV